MKKTALKNIFENFSELFAEMTPALREVMEGVLAELSRFNDFASPTQSPMSGELQGFDGISQRGTMRDLTLSEWALFDTENLEFLRRIIEQEALYRQRSFETPQNGQARCIIIDNGAWMMGHNRILALAALFWLAESANRSGQDVYWSLSGKPEIWCREISRNTVNAYLGSVAQSELSEGILAAGLRSLPKNESKELWLIGAKSEVSQNLSPQFRSALLLNTARKKDLNVNAQAGAELWTNGILHSSFTLTFPEDETCVSALRRPFAPKKNVSSNSAQPEKWFKPYWDQVQGWNIVRWQEGLLFMKGSKRLWIAIPEDLIGVGIQPHSSISSEMIWLMIKDKNVASIKFIDTSEHRQEMASSTLLFASGIQKKLNFPFPALPVISFAHGNQIRFHDVDGRRLDIVMKKNTKSNQRHYLMRYAKNDGRVLYQELGFELRMSEPNANELSAIQLINTSNGKEIVPEYWPASEEYKQAHFLVAQSDLAFATSADYNTYNIYNRLEPVISVAFPDETIPILMLSATKGFAYSKTTGKLARYRIGSQNIVHLTELSLKDGVPSELSHFRAGNRNQIGALKLDDGKPEDLILLDINKKSARTEHINLVDAIMEAES